MPKQIISHKGWAIVFHYLTRYKKDIILYSLMGIVVGIFGGVLPYIFGIFFDAILSGEQFVFGDIDMPLWLALLIAGGAIQIIFDVFSWSNDLRRRRIGTTIASQYPAEAVERLLEKPVAFHKEHKAGSMWNKIIRARSYMMQIVEQVVLQIAPELLSVILGLAITMYIQPVLGGIIIAGVSVYILSISRLVPPIVKLQKKGERAWNKAYGYAFDALANVAPVKQVRAEEYESKRVWTQYMKRVLNTWLRVENIWGGIAFYQRLIITLTRLSIFFLSVLFIQQGDLTIGGLIALNSYAAMVFGPFVRLGYNWQTIQNGIVAIERGEKILDTRPEQYVPKGVLDTKNLDGKIEFKGVNFSYNKKDIDVLKDISFVVNPGEKVALVGESGVGKSTLVDLISGYYFPHKGNIHIDDKNIKKLNLGDLREQIAVVPQEVVLFNDTIEKNIQYGSFDASKKELIDAAKEAHAHEFIQKFPKKYRQLVGERGIKLSVGQKQRVAIARAILRNPKILILDEPTSALDIQTEKQITESLEKLMEGRTTIIIAHRLSTVRKADRILVFDKGRLVEEGTHKSLIKKKSGLYKKLYKMHVGLE